MRAAGLKPISTEVHLVQAVSRCSFRSFAKRLRERTRAMGSSAGLVANDALLLEAEEVVRKYETQMPAGPGTGAHLLPLFMVVADKPLV